MKQSLLQAHQQRLGPPYQLIVQLRCHLRKCRNQNTWFRLRRAPYFQRSKTNADSGSPSFAAASFAPCCEYFADGVRGISASGCFNSCIANFSSSGREDIGTCCTRAASRPFSQNDCSADWTASGVQGADQKCAVAFCRRNDGTSGCNGSPDCASTYARTTGTRSTNFSAPASWRTDCKPPNSTSRRTPSNASHAAVANRRAAHGRWPRTSSRPRTARCTSRRSVAQARSALRSSWSEGRPDEGLRSSSAIVVVERAAADYSKHHNYRGNQRQRSSREA